MSLLKKHTVLIAMDGSKDSDWAFDWYTANMHRPGNQVFIVCCSQSSSNFQHLPVEDLDQADAMSSFVEDDNNMMSESYQKYQNKLRSSLMVGRVFTSSNTSPGKKILNTVKNHEVAMILLGAHGQGTGNHSIGSVCRYVLEHARVPVIVCRHPDDNNPKLHSPGSVGSDEGSSLDTSSSPRSNEQGTDGLTLSDVCSYWASVGSRTSDGNSRPSLSQLFLRGRSSLNSESCVSDDSATDNDADDVTRDGGEGVGPEEDRNGSTKEQTVKDGGEVVEDSNQTKKSAMVDRNAKGEIGKESIATVATNHHIIEANIATVATDVHIKEANIATVATDPHIQEMDVATVATDPHIQETKEKAEEDIAKDDLNEPKQGANGEDDVTKNKMDDVQEKGSKEAVVSVDEEQEGKRIVTERKDDSEEPNSDMVTLIGENGEMEDNDVKTVEETEIIIDGGDEIKNNEDGLECP